MVYAVSTISFSTCSKISQVVNITGMNNVIHMALTKNGSNTLLKRRILQDVSAFPYRQT